MAKKEIDLRVYKLDKDAYQVLHNIVTDLKNEKELTNKWNLPFKEDHWFGIRTQGDELELRVEVFKGGYRSTDRSDVREMQVFADETRKLLTKFEKAVRSEFKNRTGKALKWGKGKEHTNYEAVALNNLYKFYSYKSGPIRVDLGGQEFSEGTDKPTRGKLDKGEDDHKIVDTSKLSKKWG